MTQEKLTQTLADSLTHTIEHLPSIVIGFLQRFCFFFAKLNATICCPHFIFHERVGQVVLVMVRSLGFGFILLWPFNILTHTKTHTHTRCNTFCHWSSIQKFDRCSGCGNATHLHFSIFFCCFLKHFYARSKGWVEGAAASLFACRFVYTYFGICSLSVGLFIYFK